jgi:hypothetical protein
VSLCVAVDPADSIETTTDPTSGVWTENTVDGAGTLQSISCPSTTFCAAAGDDAGHILISTHPTAGPTGWTPVLADPISCASMPSLCATEQVIASDRTGLHTLDPSTEFEGQSGPQLTRLTLTGNLLTWDHDGSTMSARLTPKNHASCVACDAQPRVPARRAVASRCTADHRTPIASAEAGAGDVVVSAGKAQRTPPDGGGSDAQETSPSLRGSIKAAWRTVGLAATPELGFGEESEWAGATRTLGGAWLPARLVCLYDRIHARMRSFTARGRSTCRK